MKHLKKLHNRKQPRGLETVILKKLPGWMLASTLIPIFMSLFARVFTPEGSAASIAKQQTTVDIFSVALAVTAWTAILTVAIGCIIVFLMKGPAYVADAYEVNDANRPASRDQDRD